MIESRENYLCPRIPSDHCQYKGESESGEEINIRLLSAGLGTAAHRQHHGGDFSRFESLIPAGFPVVLGPDL